MIKIKIVQTREFEVDHRIAKYIVKLNNKGYETDYCCSGHIGKQTGGYISFNIPTTIFIKQYMIDAPSKWFFRYYGQRVALYMDIAPDRTITKDILYRRLNKLDKWIDGLPNRTDPYIKIKTRIID